MENNHKGDAAALAQELLDQAVIEAGIDQKMYERRASRRYYVAMVLKGITLFGGLAVATLDVNKVALGATISAALLIDQWFSNYKRMMSENIAAYAIDRTVRMVKDNYNDQLIDVIRINQKGDTQSAYDSLLSLSRQSALAIRNELNRIKVEVSLDNIQFLSSLNLDHPARTPLPHDAKADSPSPNAKISPA